MGVIAFGRDDLTAATKHFQDAIKLKPNLANAHLNLGMIYAVQGRLDEAISHFRRTLKANASYIKGYMLLADALALQGKPNEAIEQYNEALRMSKSLDLELEQAEARNDLSTLLCRLGGMDEGIKHLSHRPFDSFIVLYIIRICVTFHCLSK